MMRVRVDQKTLVSFMIPFAICIAAGGLLMLAVESAPDPNNSVLVSLLMNLWMVTLYALLPIFIVLEILFTRIGWYPPSVLKSRDPFLCKSDREKWGAAAGFLPLLELHASTPGAVEGTGLVGGGRPSPKRRRLYRGFLERTYHITDRESGLAVLHKLAASQRARDLCWGTLLAGMLFVCRWLSREELDDWYGRFQAGIRGRFASWAELNQGFLEEEAAAGMGAESVQALSQAAEREQNGVYQARFT